MFIFVSENWLFNIVDFHNKNIELHIASMSRYDRHNKFWSSGCITQADAVETNGILLVST